MLWRLLHCPWEYAGVTENDKRNRWESGLGMVGWGGLKTDGFFSKVSWNTDGER